MFKSTDYEIKFATETGKAPQCDKKMLEGFTQKLLVTTYLPTHQIYVLRLQLEPSPIGYI